MRRHDDLAARLGVDVLLVGGGVASVRCARTLRRLGFDGSILLAGDEPDIPYNRPPLSKELLRDDLPDELAAVEPSPWYDRRGVELRTATRVVSIDPDLSEATFEDGTAIRFGRCLVATGAEPRTLPVSGGEHALLLRTLPQARRLREAALAAGPGAPAVVVGGGFIGLEVASALASLGLRPTVVELGSTLWSGALGRSLAEWAAGRLRQVGVVLRLGAAVTALEPGAAWIGDERLEAALTVAGIGVRPRDELAAAAGLVVDDGIVADAGHATSHPAIWTAGDVARVDGRRIEHWHAAREGGERAARSMLGMELDPPAVPWVFSEVAGEAVDVVGALEPWDAERWVRDQAVLGYFAGERLVGVAIVGGAMPVEAARRLVADGAGGHELEFALVRSAG